MNCGCKAAGQARGVVFCDTHARAFEMARLLDTVRNFYLAQPTASGRDWPFVTEIDRLLPRPEREGGS